jgi:hypothetical protein
MSPSLSACPTVCQHVSPSLRMSHCLSACPTVCQHVSLSHSVGTSCLVLFLSVCFGASGCFSGVLIYIFVSRSPSTSFCDILL